MTKSARVHAFWSSFGLKAYEENSVPAGAVLPYLTYEFASADSGEECALSASLWYDEPSWKNINAKTDEISSAIGSGLVESCDGGYIRIRRRTPFAQSAGVPTNRNIRRKILNVAVMYLTPN